MSESQTPESSTAKNGAPGREEPRSDIALLLEGTYPYVRGGVSSWVHQIISSLQEFTFSLVFLGGDRESYGEMRYELPPNVVDLELRYLAEPPGLAPPRPRRGNEKVFAELPKLLDYFKSGELHPDESTLSRMIDTLSTPEGIQREDFLYSEAGWKKIQECYDRYCDDPSFLDYFWTVRSMHEPIFMLASVARSLPPARVYHSISTGYAGFLGMLLQRRTGHPYVLSEHGIYTKERKIELGQAEWINETLEPFSTSLDGKLSYTRKLWIQFFSGLGRLTYTAADPIISLYEGNRKRQLQDGADPERTRVIPNGVDLERFASLRDKRPPGVPKILGLIGRVVPIKDIKTFILTLRSVCARMPEAEGWIIGPEDEDEGYARECHDLVKSLGLTEKVKFLGFQKVEDILPQLGLMTLTSISEALPLVILEGFASGLPALATDVGSCRELIEGNQPEDRALGCAGAVGAIADPEELATHAVELLRDEERWYAAQAAGIARVEKYYTLGMMEDYYRDVYVEALERYEALQTPEPDPSAVEV